MDCSSSWRGYGTTPSLFTCLWAIYIFHFHPKYRIFAYLLFSLSVQLKLYPAIFIVMLIDNWKDWKSILRRFAGLAVFNILLLFIMGPRIFLDFLRSVSGQMSAPGWTWNGNHSINAFVFNLTKDGFRIIGSDTLEMLKQNSRILETSLFLLFVIMFFSI
jgi:Gpi18-like mannosyltransferase